MRWSSFESPLHQAPQSSCSTYEQTCPSHFAYLHHGGLLKSSKIDLTYPVNHRWATVYTWYIRRHSFLRIYNGKDRGLPSNLICSQFQADWSIMTISQSRWNNCFNFDFKPSRLTFPPNVSHHDVWIFQPSTLQLAAYCLDKKAMAITHLDLT